MNKDIDYIMNNLYEILENRIDSNESENSFHKKFLEIDKNEFEDIRIKINEEYQIIELDISYDSLKDSIDIMILDSENSNEDELKYDLISSIYINSYQYNFKKIKNIIIQIINDFLEIHYNNIKI